MGPVASAIQDSAARVFMAGGKLVSIELDPIGYDKLRAELEEHYGTGVHLSIVKESLDPLKLYCAFGVIDITKAATK